MVCAKCQRIKYPEKQTQPIIPLDELDNLNEYNRYTLAQMHQYFYEKWLKVEDDLAAQSEVREFSDIQKEHDEMIEGVKNGSNMEFLKSPEILEELQNFKIFLQHSNTFFEYVKDTHISSYNRSTSTSKFISFMVDDMCSPP